MYNIEFTNATHATLSPEKIYGSVFLFLSSAFAVVSLVCLFVSVIVKKNY